MKKQLLVLADDFSGACEMAGIARRYGLRVELQLDFNPGSDQISFSWSTAAPTG